MVSYNYCPFIVELYKEFYIFYTTRPNSMSQKAGSEYEEIVITNYDPRLHDSSRHLSAPEKTATLSLLRAKGGSRKVIRMAQQQYISKICTKMKR